MYLVVLEGMEFSAPRLCRSISKEMKHCSSGDDVVLLAAGRNGPDHAGSHEVVLASTNLEKAWVSKAKPMGTG